MQVPWQRVVQVRRLNGEDLDALGDIPVGGGAGDAEPGAESHQAPGSVLAIRQPRSQPEGRQEGKRNEGLVERRPEQHRERAGSESRAFG